MNGRQSSNSYQEDLLWGVQIEGILLATVWFAFLLYVLMRSSSTYSSKFILMLFSIKVIGAFALQAIFTYYYTDRSTADIYRFFDDGMILRDTMFTHPTDFFRMLFGWKVDDPNLRIHYFERMNAWIRPFDAGLYNDNHFMIRINALMGFVSFGYYEVHGLHFTFLSFLGIKWSVDALVKEPRAARWGLALAILFPSSLLWLSGGLKEAMLMLGIGAALKVLTLKGSNWKAVLPYALLAVFVLTQLKLYVLLFLLPAGIVLWARQRWHLRLLSSYTLWLIIGVVGIISIYLIGIDISGSIVQKQHDFINHVTEINSGSAFELSRLSPSYASLIAHIPEALMNTLIRPFPFEVSSPPESLMLLENAFIWVLLICALIARFKYGIESPSVWWMILLLLPLFILTGLVTPVFGAIMRYRAPALVLLLVSISPFIRDLWQKVLTPTQK